jgi:hypothetical protein
MLTEAGLIDGFSYAKKPSSGDHKIPDNKPPWEVGDTVTLSKGPLSGAAFESKTKSAGWPEFNFSNVEGYKFTIVHDYD